MKKSMLSLLFVSIISFSMNTCFSRNAIVWDLGGVLFHPNKIGLAIHEIGLKNILSYTLLDFKNPKKIQQRIFELLYTMGEQSAENISYAGGLQLPVIMCDWMRGNLLPSSILKEVYATMNTLRKQGFFVSDREYTLLKKTVATMFDTKVLALYMQPASKACTLLNDIKLDAHCDQYILSNWDPHSFEHLFASAHGQKIFSYFKPEHITISGTCGLIKPEPEIFAFLLAKYNLTANECIFIDDQLENIKAAQICGMQTIWFNSMTYEQLRVELIKRGFLGATQGNSILA